MQYFVQPMAAAAPVAQPMQAPVAAQPAVGGALAQIVGQVVAQMLPAVVAQLAGQAAQPAQAPVQAVPAMVPQHGMAPVIQPQQQFVQPAQAQPAVAQHPLQAVPAAPVNAPAPGGPMVTVGTNPPVSVGGNVHQVTGMPQPPGIPNGEPVVAQAAQPVLNSAVLTREQVGGMTPDQINANWPVIEAWLQAGAGRAA